MAKPTGLARRKGIYYFRIRVPKDLVSILGKKEIRKSLQTTDYGEAKKRRNQVAIEWDARFAQARKTVLVHLIIRYLRKSYPASNPAATSVLDRVVALTSNALVEKCREGEQDSVSQWFEAEHSLESFRGRGTEFIDVIVDKLES